MFLLKTSVIPYYKVLLSTLSLGIIIGVLYIFGIILYILFRGSKEVLGLLYISFGFVLLVRIANNIIRYPLFLFRERFRVLFKKSN
jgi:hypothetical protein